LTTSSTTATLDVQNGVCTGSASFVEGVAQVETTTVVAAAGGAVVLTTRNVSYVTLT